MKNGFIAILTILLITSTVSLQSQTILDQSQLNYNSGVSARTLPGYNVFQTFTAGITGTLSEVHIGFFNYINGNGVLNIYAGSGILGTLLQTQTVTVVCPNNSSAILPFNVSVPVISGQEYTFQFIPGAGMPDPYGVQAVNPGSYTKGYMGLKDPSGTYPTAFDMVFKTYVTSVSCGIPVNLNTTSITSGSAILNWNSVTGAISYDIQYKQSSATVWTSVTNILTNSAAINNLAPSSSHQWQVLANCSNGSSAFAPIKKFATTAPAECPKTENPFTTDITDVQATVSWDVVPDATAYTVQYKAVADTSWTNFSNISLNQKILENLTPGTDYQWRVQCNCINGNNSVWTTAQFSTNASVSIMRPGSAARLFPNPVVSNLYVQLPNNYTTPGEVCITDMFGRIVIKQTISSDKTGNVMFIPVQQLAPGMYTLKGVDNKVHLFFKQ